VLFVKKESFKNFLFIIGCTFFLWPFAVSRAAAVEAFAEQPKINLVWQPTFDADDNLAYSEKLPGVNVVSPSFFAIVNADGLVEDKADASYVENLHQKGYKVWALVTNSFDPELTQALLANADARKYATRQLMFLCEKYQLDGINLDLENIHDEDQAALTVFVEEITTALRAEGKVVSIDITVPSTTPDWSQCYDRKELGRIVDYVMLMAYDEHWRSSKVSGSVASIGWVETNLQKTLADIPARKVILGIPFYTRLWQEQDGRVVQAKTLTMEGTERLLAEKKVSARWDSELGQYYFSYEENGFLYRVWQEEQRSLALKAQLVSCYDLAGVASWRKGFEQPETWLTLNKALTISTGKNEKTEHVFKNGI